MPSVPPDTAVTTNAPPSGSLSRPEPLLANTLPAVIAVSSVVATASFCATAGSSMALMVIWVNCTGEL